jgi:hypothetical protein
MYCSSCGVAVTQGLSYCNYCGAKLGGAKGDGVIKSSEIKPELLVSAMLRAFVLGLLAIAFLIGVLKAVAGFDLPFLLVATGFSFLLMLVVESVLIGLLLSGRRGARGANVAGRLKGQTAQELGEAQARALPDPVPSVTEHTTRTLEPAYSKRQSE